MYCEYVVSGRMVAGSSMVLVTAMVFLETLLVLVLIYGIETMIWKEKESSRIKAIQIDNLRGLLGIRRMGKVLNAQLR